LEESQPFVVDRRWYVGKRRNPWPWQHTRKEMEI